MKKKSKLENNFIPVNKPKVFTQDKINVNKCLNTAWLSSEGSYVKMFEKQFSKYNNRNYGIAVSSGTAALEIALKSLNLKKGDEVIIPAFSIISTALCIVKLGLKPILVDVDLENWNVVPEQVINKISRKTKAIIMVSKQLQVENATKGTCVYILIVRCQYCYSNAYFSAYSHRSRLSFPIQRPGSIN